MTSGKAELLAGAAGAAVFLVTLVGLGWPWWVALAITAAIYLGFNLLLGGVLDERMRSLAGGIGVTLEQLRLQVEHEEKAVKDLRKLARHIIQETIRARVLSVCDICEKIFQNFREDPEDLRQAQRFLIHFQKLLPLVQDYVHLSSDPDRRQVLTAADEAGMQKMLGGLEENLRNAYQAFQENNLQKLRMATGVLQRMIELDDTGHRLRR
jgi:hypothetical protein